MGFFDRFIQKSNKNESFFASRKKIQEQRHSNLTILVQRGILNSAQAMLMEKQCLTSEECISILRECETPQEIRSGFSKIIGILKTCGDPSLPSVQQALSMAQNDNQLPGIKDAFIKENLNFCDTIDETIRKKI
jgi:hypothetical protein